MRAAIQTLARLLGVVALGAVGYVWGTWLAEPTQAATVVVLATAVVGLVAGLVWSRRRRRAMVGPAVRESGSVARRIFGRREHRQAAAREVPVPSSAPPRRPEFNGEPELDSEPEVAFEPELDPEPDLDPEPEIDPEPELDSDPDLDPELDEVGRPADVHDSTSERPVGFSVTASKTVAVPVERLYEAFVDESLRRRWLPDGDLRERTAIKPKSASFDWGDGSTRLIVGFAAKGEEASVAALNHARFADAEKADQMELFWGERMAALKEDLEGS